MAFQTGPFTGRNPNPRVGPDAIVPDGAGDDATGKPRLKPSNPFGDEAFHQTFSGADYKITAVIPWVDDYQLNRNREEAIKLANALAKVQAKVTAGTADNFDKVLIKGMLDQLDQLAKATATPRPFYRQFSEIQTLSMTTRRSVHPVRRLGEASPAEYTRGPRTIAGSMIFIMLDGDVLLDLARRTKRDAFDSQPVFTMDRLPPFNILIQGVNERGSVVRGALYGVTLLASGVTLSIDDLYTEQHFTYVAKWMEPIASVGRLDLMKRDVGGGKGNTGAVSDLDRLDLLGDRRSIVPTTPPESGGTPHQPGGISAGGSSRTGRFVNGTRHYIGSRV